MKLWKALSVANIAAILGYTPANAAITPRILGASSSPIVAPADDTNQNLLVSIPVPANLLGAAGQLRIVTQWSYTNSVNNKLLFVRFNSASGTGGTAYLGLTATTTVGVKVITTFGNAGATNSQRGSQVATNGTPSATAIQTSAIDTTAQSFINITATKATGSETITLESYSVEFIPAV